MMDRYQLRYFLAVVDHGNFSRAAAHCNVSQPTLSAGIAKLERDLGSALFLRNSQRVELTPSGSRLLPHARQIESGFNQARQSLTGIGSRPATRLGVLRSVSGSVLAGITRSLFRMDPAAKIELVEGSERELASHLARGRIDCALTLVARGNDRFLEEPLLEEGYALALPAAHPLAHQPAIAAEALADEVMIVRRHCEALSYTSRHFTERGVRPHFSYRSTNDERVLQMVAAGLGVTVMPESYVAAGVVRVALAEFEHRRALGLLYAPDWEGRSTAPDAVIAAIRSVLRPGLDPGTGTGRSGPLALLRRPQPVEPQNY